MIVEVHNEKLANQFLALPAYIYRNDPNWISPLHDDIEAVFDPERNAFFKAGAAKRWLSLDDDGNVSGRIAAFVHDIGTEHMAGGIGFFECIDDQSIANELFDVAVSWLGEQGLNEIKAPINFGENDKFWGLLVQGFHPPSYGMNYNPPYYERLFTTYGFKKDYDQYTNMLDLTIPFPERFTKIADWVADKPGYKFMHFEPSKKEKFFRDFQEIYNLAWKDFEHFHPMDLDTIRESFRQMKPIMDKRVIWFAYFEDQPIAFVICIPDVNQILKHLNGKMNLWNKLRFAWIKHTKTIDRLRIIAMGCVPKFHNKGVESALIRCLEKEVIPRNTITHVELAWVADFNDKMQAVHNATGAKLYKTHRTYALQIESTPSN